MNNFHALSNGNGHIEQKSSVKNVAARSPWPLNVPVKIIGGWGANFPPYIILGDPGAVSREGRKGAAEVFKHA